MDNDECKQGKETDDVGLNYAVKALLKSSSREGKERLRRLEEEYSLYRSIDSFRDKYQHVLGKKIIRCYGIYETDSTVILLLEHAGECFDDWHDIPLEER